MRAVKAPLYVRHRPNLGLIVISTDPGNGRGEQSLITLTPSEAVNLGMVLADMGKEHGGVTA
jgi:hypothetical protein